VNLDKQIKRHVIGRRHLFFAVAAPDLEALVAREAGALSDTIQVEPPQTGGVSFSGRLEDLYRANLCLRTAGRILMRLAEFKATNFRQLEKKTAEVPWARYLPHGTVPACKTATRQSRLYHSQAVGETVQRAVRQYWRELGAAAIDDPGQTLFVRLDSDTLQLSLDSSGANLYRRGLKTHAAAAPLRETLAAAVLQLAGYDPTRPLLDPMCGSGTFALEAALIAKQIPPGFMREFAFMQWPSFRPARWNHLKTSAAKKVRTLDNPLIHASDIDPGICGLLEGCVRAHDLSDAVTVRCADFFSLPAEMSTGRDTGPGLIVINPPYGRRLRPDRLAGDFYSRIGAKLARDFKGWLVAWIVPRPELVSSVPVHLRPLRLTHGGLSLSLFVGRI
jgi:putative N6-adenine-specific DNA methylase